MIRTIDWKQACAVRLGHLGPVALAILATGCGGGGSSGQPAVTPTSFVVSGVAATGAPMAGASVTIQSASGAQVCATTTDSQGAYTCTIDATAQVPLVVQADDGASRQYSTVPEAQDSTANATPLTTLVVARLSPTGNPAAFAAEVATNAALASPQAVTAKVAEVAALIAPLTAAVGDATNPLTGRFDASGVGHDKVLDALQVTIRPEGSSSNIEVTFKLTPSSDQATPVSANFRSNEAAPPPPAASVRPQDLPDERIATLVQGFLDRMRACYALPLAQRIGGVAPGAGAAQGGPSSVVAEACRSLFIDNDPGAYLDQGLRVGSSGGFPGMFRESSTGASFDRGNFEYRWANGDILMSFRSVTTTGAVGHSVLTLRNQEGGLKAVGNQYAYEANVRPYVLRRSFPLQPRYDYLATGYSVSIANRTDAQGNAVFSQAIVTTPTGRQLLLRPQPGRSNMTIVRGSGELSGTGVEFFAATFVDPTTPGNPAERDTAPVFVNNQLTDEQLRSIPNHGVWRIEFVHADGVTPNVTQVYRTIERASTLGEARQMSFAQFSDSLTAGWLARADVQAFAGITSPAPSATEPTVLKIEGSDGSDGWSVPPGAVAPTSVFAFGWSASGQRYNDVANVTTVDRKATIGCARQSSLDDHCDSSTGTTQFAQGGRTWTLELWGRSIRQVERTTSVAFWRLPD